MYFKQSFNRAYEILLKKNYLVFDALHSAAQKSHTEKFNKLQSTYFFIIILLFRSSNLVCLSINQPIRINAKFNVEICFCLFFIVSVLYFTLFVDKYSFNRLCCLSVAIKTVCIISNILQNDESKSENRANL